MHAFEELAPNDEILLFDPLEERGQLSIGDRFRRLDPAIQNVDTVIIRSSSRSTLSAIERDPVLADLLNDRNMLHLGRSSDPDRPGPGLVPLWMNGPETHFAPDELRQAELEALLRRTQSVFEDNNHHYVLPSGWHADRFIRIANACSSLPDNRRLADWLLEYVDEQHDLLADTGTILPVLQEVQRHCILRFGWQTKIDALSEYPSVDTLAAGVEDLRARGSNSRGILFVISVDSSGASWSRFETKLRDPERDRTVVVCEARLDLDARHRPWLVSIPSRRWMPDHSGECEACGSPARVTVHPKTYEPTAQYGIEMSAISPGVAQADNHLFEILSRHDAVRLHYTSDRGAHYAVWVDTPKLLRQEEPRSSFLEFVNAAAKPEIVLIPDGPASEELWSIAAEATGVEPHVVSHRSGLAPEVVAQVQTATRVLIVDDTVVSGTTLGRLRRLVYQAAQPMGRSPHTAARVFLARPSGTDDLVAIRRPFRSAEGSGLESLYEVRLPSGQQCPFCTERLLLRSWYDRLSEESKSVAAERLGVLDGEIEGSPLLGSAADQPDVVTAGAFFGDLSERAGFAAASAAVTRVLDEMRTVAASGKAHAIDIAAALDAYFDPCLLVGVLRTCRKEQVRFATTDAAIGHRYSRLADFGEALTDAVRCEVAWAALREVIPPVGVETVLDGVQSPIATLLLELLQLRLAYFL